MPTLTMPALFLALFINRLVELVKKAFVDPSVPESKEPAWVSPLLLSLSLLFGAAGVVLMFPSANLFGGLGASSLAEQVATGVVIGGFANGFDFISGTLSDLAAKASAK